MKRKRAKILIAVLLAGSLLTAFSACGEHTAESPDGSRIRVYDLSGEQDAEETPEISDEGAAEKEEGPTDEAAPEALEETQPETEAFPEETGTPVEIEPFAALKSHEAVVKSYAELKSALADNNGITTVYFGDNITMQSSGIRINPNKASVIVDGINPIDPEQEAPYTLTDYSSSSFSNTIYIDAAGVSSLHVRDLNITGKNYYGPFSAEDSSATAGAVITYERVSYNGPQLVYHRRGTAKIIDCTVSIHGGNGGSTNQEFSETKHLIFEGTNTISTATSGNSVFWHPSGGSFKVADDSSLVVTSPNTSISYGVFYAGGSSYNVDITVGSRAVLNMTISGIVAPASYVNLSSLTVREGGTFSLTTTKAPSAPILRMGGALTVEKDASFVISGYGSTSYAVLRQESGDITVEKDATFHIIAESAHMNLLSLFGRAFICNDPASVLLYNANRDIQATTSAGRVYINAQQVNYWNALSMGGLDSSPLYRWEKADKTNFVIDGTLAVDSGGNFTSISSNYVSGDAPGTAPSASSFSMVSARILAFGRLELTVTEPTTRTTVISGTTEPGAAVRVSFTQEGESYAFPDVTADSAGVFHVPISVPLNEGSVVTVKSSWQYLSAAAQAVVSGEGGIELSVPDFLEFFITELASSPQTVKRLDSNWKIVASDTSAAGGQWSVYARLEKEMTPVSGSLPVLDGALVFVDASGLTAVMSTDSDVLIIRQSTAGGEEIYPVVWDEDEGILLIVAPGRAFADTVYSATILWTLVSGP